ncbi:hypothetical protein H257_17842 [Aphanomyces astaci]|uniref:Uncharacterized protein n=1 Tax=Aphanomyces astaci TaxID=112090 RepID=W4FF97_APHAT|nr:hypothetical protein H257_17842 [Aphanomyces astaci]ETV65413.1 hypothetical protein H257_17842 [Aphanomyces astaci]|eukprot:XP_009845090.1 hypothetical protein H257_17842 [Aphanomyces astaci]
MPLLPWQSRFHEKSSECLPLETSGSMASRTNTMLLPFPLN